MKNFLASLFLLLPFLTMNGFSQIPSMPAAILGIDKICPGDSAGFSIAAVSGATSYTWTVPSTATITNGQGTTSINVVFDSCWGGGDITVTASNGFGTSPAQTITITFITDVIFNNMNVNSVSNGGISPFFTVTYPVLIRLIQDYHWNGGGGQPGTISLLDTATGITYGPWPANVNCSPLGPNIFWIVWPATLIPAGTYKIIDSDPSTWSQNSESGGYGFSEVEICVAGCSSLTPSQTNPVCFGGNDGTATVTTSDTSLTFSWSTNPQQTTPTATGLTIGTYTVSITDTTPEELIINGDFSGGEYWFGTDYTFCNSFGCLTTEGYYTANTDPNIYNNAWTGSGHTTVLANNFMIVNGSTAPGINVWCQTVMVMPNSDYDFSAWVSTMDTGANPAQLQFSINGINIGGVFTAPTGQNVWVQFSATWNSGANTLAAICIVDQNTSGNSNDFGLDDISFFGLPGENCNETITFTITQPILLSSAVDTAICSGQSIFVGGGWQLTAGTYLDTLKSVNDCDSIIVTTLTVNQTFNTPATATICSGDSIFLGGSWQKAGGAYYDTLSSQGGCDSVIATALTVNPTFLANTSSSICQGDSIFINGSWLSAGDTYYDTLVSMNGCDSVIATTLTGNPTYITPATTPICSGDSIFINGNWLSSGDTYYDTLVSMNGCDSVIAATLTGNPTYITPGTTAICSGENIFLGGGWQTTAGTYNDTLQTTSGCDSIIQTTLTVNPLPVITLSDDTLINIGSTITLTATGGQEYLWQSTDGLSCTNCPSPDATPLESTVYYVTVTNSNSCSSNDSVTITVNDIICREVYIPNIFSPNEDGENDVLNVYISDERCIKEMKFIIYDRWGEKVFESNEIKAGWDGKYRGKWMNTGVYVYYFKATLLDENESKIKGNVTVVK